MPTTAFACTFYELTGCVFLSRTFIVVIVVVSQNLTHNNAQKYERCIDERVIVFLSLAMYDGIKFNNILKYCTTTKTVTPTIRFAMHCKAW